MTSIITIRCSDETPSDNELVYCWSGYSETESVRSILNYVEANGERLRSKYLKWVHDLGETRIKGKRLIDHLAFEEGMSYWWMTLFVEKSLYKSPISDAIRLLAIEEIIVEQKPDKVRLVGDNTWLRQALSDLCKSIGREFEWNAQTRIRVHLGNRKDIYRFLPVCLQALMSLMRHLWQRWPFRSSERSGWLGGGDALFFCSYFDNIDPIAAEQGKFHSRYWQALLNLLYRKKRPTNWLHLFVPNNEVNTPGAAMRWARLFKESEEKNNFHTFLDAYLSWRIVLRIIYRWMWLFNAAWRLREVKYSFRPQDSQLSLWPLLRRDWKQSMYGPVAIHNLLAIELFDRALQVVPQQKQGLYLCENQAWERALIHSWRKHGHKCLIAVVHSTVRFWDLRYFADARIYEVGKTLPIPQPDLVALNGRAAVANYLHAGYPQKSIIECEAIRYSYLNDKKASRSVKHKSDGAGEKVLILGDISKVMTESLLKLLESSMCDNLPPNTYHIKPHPNCPVKVEQYPTLKLSLVTNSLEDSLRDYDTIVASNGTSAAVDAYLYGMPVIVVLVDTELNFSPLRGQKEVKFVSTSEELVAAFMKNCKNDNRVLATDDFFFLDPELPRWSRLLEN